jgi:hypothetical protein
MNLGFSDLLQEQKDTSLEINRTVVTKINKYCNDNNISIAKFMHNNDLCRRIYTNMSATQKKGCNPVNIKLFTFVRIASAMEITVDELIKK